MQSAPDTSGQNSDSKSPVPRFGSGFLSLSSLLLRGQFEPAPTPGGLLAAQSLQAERLDHTRRTRC